MTAIPAVESVRPPAVAGLFYPGDKDELRIMLEGLLKDAVKTDYCPKAIIAPHAGYVYSGPVAASAYATLANCQHAIERVVLVGPDHRVGFRGIAAPSSSAFQTPLGTVSIDQKAIYELGDLVTVYDIAHEQEHSLEVHLPFLQIMLGEFKLVPLVISSALTEEVADVLRRLWGGAETLIVVSSDLSHYLDYDIARETDAATTEAIERMDGDIIHSNDACGFQGIRGLLRIGIEKDLQEETLDVRNSGDTAGPKSQVVGYGAYLFR